MRALVVALVMSLSTTVVAQEIGTEIEPTGPKRPDITVPPPPPDDPYASNPVEPVTPKPKELPPPPPPKKANKKKADTNMGPGASAGYGSMGVRASFGGGAGVAAGGSAPTVGMTFFATDQVGITADVGFGLSLVRGNMSLGWSAGVGIVFALLSPAEQLRPVIAANVAVGMPVSQNFDTFLLVGNVGGGAEYFFNQHFSVSALMMVGVPIDFSSGDLSIFTFSPGVGATLYF